MHQVLADTMLTLDDKPIDLEILAARFPAKADVKKVIGQISLSLQAPWVLAHGTHRLQLMSRHRRTLSSYLVNALVPVDREMHITGQQRSADRTDYVLDFQRDKSTLLPLHSRVFVCASCFFEPFPRENFIAKVPAIRNYV